MKEKNYEADNIYLASSKNIDLTKRDIKKEEKAESRQMFFSVDDVTDTKKVFKVEEIAEKRKVNGKVFKMNNGTEKMEIYPEAMHIYDENNHCFEKIDNSITEDAQAGCFKNGNSHFAARFSKNQDNDELFSIEKSGYKLTVYVRKSKKKLNQGVVPTLYKKRLDEFDEEGKDWLLFSGAMEGSDLEYSVTGNGIKENIVVKEKSAVYRYPFVIECENVTVAHNESEKQVLFKDKETGADIFCIPAPFMYDAKGEKSSSVTYEVKELSQDKVAFTVIADSDWINTEEREFPVVIDPQITVSGSNAISTYSWCEGVMSNENTHTIGTTEVCECECCCSKVNRMYMNFTMPSLPFNPRIKKAELIVKQASGYVQRGVSAKLGLYRLKSRAVIGYNTPAQEDALLDYAKMRSGSSVDGKSIEYTFDITSFVDQIKNGETTNFGLVLRMLDESSISNSYSNIYGASCSAKYAPIISVTYESSYGVNTSYRTHTHELGRFGQGSVDLQCGNLMFESDDFAWGGNRMPVTLKHLYNSALANYQYTKDPSIKLNTANFSAMRIGCGMKLNVMQSMMSTSFQHEGTIYEGYVYINENGEEKYFVESSKTACDENCCCYKLYEDISGNGMYYDPYKLELTIGTDIYSFDSAGRLISITDEYKNKQTITYTSGKITSVSDGVGRDFGFSYNSSGFLTSITAPDETSITYVYADNLLTDIIYPNNKKVTIGYSSNKPTLVTLYDRSNAVYKVEYTFAANKVASISEYGVDESGTFVAGVSSTYSYSAASGRTLVQTTEPKDTDEGESADNIFTTVYTFDDNGNIVSEYIYSKDVGNVGGDGEESGINPHSGDGGAGVVSNINNLLKGHNFKDISAWLGEPCNKSDIYIKNYPYESYAKYGKSVLRMQSTNADAIGNGVYQTTVVLPAGKYTFSTYLRVVNKITGANSAGAYIRVTDTNDNILAESEKLTIADSEYTRLISPFELTEAKAVKVHILLDGKGTIYADAAQLENNPYANAYNMLENGNFERGIESWSNNGAYISENTRFNMSKSLQLNGKLDFLIYAYQSVAVKTFASTRETFTLSGWAKGHGLPTHERYNANTPLFRLRADIIYTDGTKQTETADFCPDTEDWQFTSVQFAKANYKNVREICVYCEYGYNSGIAYFDDIQLVRNSIETGLSNSDFEGIKEDGAEITTEETVADNSTPAFQEATDSFGNALTETTFTDGEFGTIYRSFGFDTDGNELVRETDAQGHETSYIVDEDTSRNEEVIDRLDNKTAYEYDKSGRTTKVTSKDADGTELAHVSYAYDTFDNMTEIVRGDGMKYALAYNEFHNLESIGIEGKSEALIKYAYKNGNGRLKQMAYANGHTMKAVYNSIGQMVAEKWFESESQATDSTANPIAHYKYTYDGEGNIVHSIDILAQKEYNYEYEEGRIVRATEADITLSGEIVTAKFIVNTVKYYYDTEGKMTKKVITPASGSAQTIYYETNDDNTVVKFSAGGRTVTSHSKTDSFGRKVFDEIQLGTDFVSRQFVYHAGKVTAEHKTNAKVKSSATTQLVSQIILSDGRAISYDYDDEERIIKVDDTIDGVVEYTYDALGQLETETKDGVTTKFKYDNYGNITAKGEVDENSEIAPATKVSYVYGNDTWKDLLTSFNGQAIEYDAQGNPISYLGHTLTWEKGRQLKKFDNIEYTYNAKGIRTSKTVDGVKHSYILDGTKILCETWDNHTLIPIHDSENSVCGIIYNDAPYYFVKNLQGDVIAIVDKDAQTVARYSYDAWGVPNITSDSSDCQIATINPFRYRGYFYDEETKLYYLLSRYYNPELGRFINADSIEWLGTNERIIETNIFAYCKNDCVNLSDEVGFGGIDTLLSVLNSSIDILAKIIDMIGNSYNKERKALENSVKLLTKKQSRQLSNIKTLQKETGKLSKRLGWIGYGITFLTLVIGFAASYNTGRNLATSLIELGIETFISLIEIGAGKLFEWIARFIPYVGFLIGLIAGWLISYLLSKFFDSRRVARITAKFKASVKNIKISLGNWVKYAVKSLNA